MVLRNLPPAVLRNLWLTSFIRKSKALMLSGKFRGQESFHGEECVWW